MTIIQAFLAPVISLATATAVYAGIHLSFKYHDRKKRRKAAETKRVVEQKLSLDWNQIQEL
jgi:hypothetical protein